MIPACGCSCSCVAQAFHACACLHKAHAPDTGMTQLWPPAYPLPVMFCTCSDMRFEVAAGLVAARLLAGQQLVVMCCVVQR